MLHMDISDERHHIWNQTWLDVEKTSLTEATLRFVFDILATHDMPLNQSCYCLEDGLFFVHLFGCLPIGQCYPFIFSVCRNLVDSL